MARDRSFKGSYRNARFQWSSSFMFVEKNGFNIALDFERNYSMFDWGFDSIRDLRNALRLKLKMVLKMVWSVLGVKEKN